MSDSEYFKQLLKHVAEGSVEAGEELLNLQRQGRALRMYPEGRKSTDDIGEIAFAIQCFGEPLHRKWLLKAGVVCESISISETRAKELVSTVLQLIRVSAVEAYPVRCVFEDGVVWIQMPEKASEWWLTDYQLLGLVGSISILLSSHGRL